MTITPSKRSYLVLPVLSPIHSEERRAVDASYPGSSTG